MASSRSSSSSKSSRLESVEARLVYYKKNEAVLEDSINVLKLEVRLRDNALYVYKLNLEKAEAERDQKGLGYDAATAASPAVEGFVNLTDKFGLDKAYHVVPSPLSRNFLPGKPDLTFIDEIVESENLDVTTVVTPKCCAPINEELVSDGKKKTIVPTIPKVDVVRPKQQEKPVRKTVKYAEMYRQVNTARQKAVDNVVRTNRVNVVKALACWGKLETKLEDLVRLNGPKVEKRAGAELTQQNDKS
ncbi:hypothetical protein Tco_1500358 [Tanacetum coccineum]